MSSVFRGDQGALIFKTAPGAISFSHALLSQTTTREHTRMSAARPLLDNNDPSSSIDEEYEAREKMAQMHQRRKPLLRKENIGWAILGCALLAFTVGLSAGVATIVVMGWQSRGESGSSCFQKTSAPSPLTRDLDVSYHTQLFNGSFLQETIYRQEASPEVDAAWEALGVNCE